MEYKSTNVLIQLGIELISMDTIREYSLQKNVELEGQRAKRKKNYVENSTCGGMFLGGVAAAIPGAAVAIIGSGGAALAIMAGGMLAGSVAGHKKGDKKFEENKKNRILDHSVLTVTLVNGRTLNFCADSCNFNIYEKYNELKEKTAVLDRIKEINTKIENGNDPGEEKVDYAIKWCLAELTNPVVIIKRDCESKYRYGCILLSEPELIDEPQEYDHILVSDIGIVLIETKHWKGHIEIRSDGKWLRYTDDGQTGVESPAFQMQRHEMLVKKMLPNVPIYSLLCFSNNSVILDGQENFEDYPIVYVDQLKNTLVNIFKSEKKSDVAIEHIVEEIEKHKVNRI